MDKSSSRDFPPSSKCARLLTALEAGHEVDADLRRGLIAFLRSLRPDNPDISTPSNEALTAIPAEHPWSESYAQMLELVGGDEMGSALAVRLRTFPEAALNRALDVVAIQFFVDFWGELGAKWRESEPAREFVQHLNQFLQQALRLFPFAPQSYQDYPDGWMQRIGSGGMVTGRVRRVVRPGLQDEQNQLRLPALVEVD